MIHPFCWEFLFISPSHQPLDGHLRASALAVMGTASLSTPRTLEAGHGQQRRVHIKNWWLLMGCHEVSHGKPKTQPHTVPSLQERVIPYWACHVGSQWGPKTEYYFGSVPLANRASPWPRPVARRHRARQGAPDSLGCWFWEMKVPWGGWYLVADYHWQPGGTHTDMYIYIWYMYIHITILYIHIHCIYKGYHRLPVVIGHMLDVRMWHIARMFGNTGRVNMPPWG